MPIDDSVAKKWGSTNGVLSRGMFLRKLTTTTRYTVEIAKE